MALRLDPRLTGFARDMRKAPTPIEAALWSKLRSSQLDGFEFRRQAVIGNAIADFFCPSIGLVVEVDGSTHDAAKDARRDAMMRNTGIEVLRFSNHEVGANLEGVLTTILTVARGRPSRFSTSVPHPPAPSPEGEKEA